MTTQWDSLYGKAEYLRSHSGHLTTALLLSSLEPVTSCLDWQESKNNNKLLSQLAKNLSEVRCIASRSDCSEIVPGQAAEAGTHLLPTPDQPSCASDMRTMLTKQRKLELGHAGSALGAVAASSTTPARNIACSKLEIGSNSTTGATAEHLCWTLAIMLLQACLEELSPDVSRHQA